MIVITGPGRTGTSVLARIYQELGFDPGGSWDDEVRAGYEAPDVVEANEAVIAKLGMTHLGAPTGTRSALRSATGRLLPQSLRPWAKARFARLPILSSAQPSMLRWERFHSVVEELAPKLREIAANHDVVKDPRFCWTLSVWAAAGVPIQHVTVTVRQLESMVRSRRDARHLQYRTSSGAKNGFAYSLGLCAVALVDYRIPNAVLRFPDFLETPEAVFAALRFPDHVSEATFKDTFARVVQPELVHEEPQPSSTRMP